MQSETPKRSRSNNIRARLAPRDLVMQLLQVHRRGQLKTQHCMCQLSTNIVESTAWSVNGWRSIRKQYMTIKVFIYWKCTKVLHKGRSELYEEWFRSVCVAFSASQLTDCNSRIESWKLRKVACLRDRCCLVSRPCSHCCSWCSDPWCTVKVFGQEV